ARIRRGPFPGRKSELACALSQPSGSGSVARRVGGGCCEVEHAARVKSISSVSAKNRVRATEARWQCYVLSRCRRSALRHKSTLPRLRWVAMSPGAVACGGTPRATDRRDSRASPPHGRPPSPALLLQDCARAFRLRHPIRSSSSGCGSLLKHLVIPVAA